MFPLTMGFAHISSLLKANILVNKDRRACIADFSLTTITGVATQTFPGGSQISTFMSGDTLMSFVGGGTTRWMSPELLVPEQFGISPLEGDRPTRQSDCYALGMVIYEVRTLIAIPFFLTVNLGCPRFCVGSIHSTKLKAIRLAIPSSMGKDQRNRRGQGASVSTASCGRSSNNAGRQIAMNGPQWRRSLPV